jgi:hypothetical protein
MGNAVVEEVRGILGATKEPGLIGEATAWQSKIVARRKLPIMPGEKKKKSYPVFEVKYKGTVIGKVIQAPNPKGVIYGEGYLAVDTKGKEFAWTTSKNTQFFRLLDRAVEHGVVSKEDVPSRWRESVDEALSLAAMMASGAQQKQADDIEAQVAAGFKAVAAHYKDALERITGEKWKVTAGKDLFSFDSVKGRKAIDIYWEADPGSGKVVITVEGPRGSKTFSRIAPKDVRKGDAPQKFLGWLKDTFKEWAPIFIEYGLTEAEYDDEAELSEMCRAHGKKKAPKKKSKGVTEEVRGILDGLHA